MTDFKQLYEREYKNNLKLIAFIESLKSSTDEWDDLCDCPCRDGEGETHQTMCRTTQIRKDEEEMRRGYQ